MTPSNPRTDQVALSAAFSRAVDLSALKRPPTPPASTPGAAPAAGGTAPVEVTEATFSAEVVEKSMQALVVVDLWSARSPVSAQLSPILERAVAEHPGMVVLVRVDVDTNPRIGQAFGVQQVPTVVAVAAGQPVDAFSGAQPEAQITAWLQSLVDALRDRLPGVPVDGAVAAPPEPEPDPLVLAAEDALEAGDFDTAIAAYEQLLAADPANTDAQIALDQLRFQQRAFALPADAAAVATADPDNLPAQFDAGDLLFATGQVEPAFTFLVDVVSRFYGDDRTAARDHLLELFALLGNDDPLVIKYRRRLAAALY